MSQSCGSVKASKFITKDFAANPGLIMSKTDHVVQTRPCLAVTSSGLRGGIRGCAIVGRASNVLKKTLSPRTSTGLVADHVQLFPLYRILEHHNELLLGSNLRSVGRPANGKCKVCCSLRGSSPAGIEVPFATCSDHGNHRTGRFLSC